MPASVLFADGAEGLIVSKSSLEGHGEQVVVRLETGQTIVIPARMLIESGDGYSVALQPSAFEVAAGEGDSDIVIPLVEEQLQVGKREIETTKIRLVKTVTERQEMVDLPLIRNEVDVNRVSKNEFVDFTPQIRYEGNTTIIPILEEVLVVEKRLRLVEEIHITPRKSEYHAPQAVTLRKEEMTGERTPVS